MWVKEASGKEGLRRSINEEITGRLYVRLPMSYSLPSSLFWQKRLGNPSPFSLFWVDVLVRLGALVSWHWGYPFQAAENPFWKHCWHQGIRSVSRCCHFCQCKFCLLLKAGHGWLFPVSCLFDWAKVCSSAISATPSSKASWHLMSLKSFCECVFTNHIGSFGTPLWCAWGLWSFCLNTFVWTLSSPCCGDGLTNGSPLGQKR